MDQNFGIAKACCLKNTSYTYAYCALFRTSEFTVLFGPQIAVEVIFKTLLVALTTY